MSPLRILITGGLGLVGADIVEYLFKAGHTVVCVSRQVDQSKLLDTSIEYYSLDISDFNFLKQARAIPRCDVIIHVAAVKSSHLFEQQVSLTNCLGMQQILHLAHDWHAQHFIYISSIGVIGRPRTLPISEDHPINPLTAYHASKLFGEHLVRLAKTEQLKVATLRISSPIGINNLQQHKTIFYLFVERALRGKPLELLGKATRGQNYVDSRDIASAVLKTIERGAEGVFNIANDKTISNYELARMCIEVLSSASAIQWLDRADPDDQINWDIAIKKATEVLGYYPEYAIADSIKRVASIDEHFNS